MIIVKGLIIVDKRLLFLLLILCSSSVFAADISKINTNWDNFGQPISNSLMTALGGSAKGAKLVEGLFYPVKEWEMEVCIAGVTSDLGAQASSGTFGASTDVSLIYGPLTATITAQKYSYSKNESLYEIGWYVQPRDAEVSYSIYLMTKNKKKYYIIENLPADTAQGDSGFYAEYLDKEFITAYLVQTSACRGKVCIEKPILDTPIIINPFGAEYGVS
jgi:hypothetical protein